MSCARPLRLRSNRSLPPRLLTRSGGQNRTAMVPLVGDVKIIFELYLRSQSAYYLLSYRFVTCTISRGAVYDQPQKVVGGDVRGGAAVMRVSGRSKRARKTA